MTKQVSKAAVCATDQTARGRTSLWKPNHLLNASFLVAWIVLGGAASVCGQTSSHLSVTALRQLELPDVVLQSVQAVAPDRQKHTPSAAYVDVRGVIGGNIRFELLLPESWNGRFVMGGGGGFVGSVQNQMRGSVNRGYATVGTDTGHEWKNDYMARWARDNLEAQLDFGYLAVHRTAAVAKALICDYYHKNAEYCYFIGCSRGGGQAMMEAQRYPQDFNGIVAGAPAFNWTGFGATMVAIAQALYPNPNQLNHPVLTKAALKKLQAGILAQCDAQDGLKDGVIQDPPSVHFDLSKVSGLTAAQRRAIAAIYRGAQNAEGSIYPGYTAGAACIPDQWIAWLVGSLPPLVAQNHVPDLTFAFGTQIFKYFVFENPEWNYATYHFSHYRRDTRLAASFLNATDPDLAGLKARHGKLILWHGWADPALPALGTVDYYRQVLAHDPHAPDYCRLFMVPGCLHCGGGPGASQVDWLSVIVNWVEHGQAPNRVIASKTSQGKIVMTRPLYPYPEYAVYRGSGDPSRATNFVVVRPHSGTAAKH